MSSLLYSIVYFFPSLTVMFFLSRKSMGIYVKLTNKLDIVEKWSHHGKRHDERFPLCKLTNNFFTCVCYRLLHGQRPYWWVYETKFYSEDNRPDFDQFELTCETGPGQ